MTRRHHSRRFTVSVPRAVIALMGREYYGPFDSQETMSGITHLPTIGIPFGLAPTHSEPPLSFPVSLRIQH